MIQIFQKTAQADPWFLQIQQLSLSKLQKIVVMNSWKQIININEICLNLRSHFYYLYSQTLRDMIQLELNKNMGATSIKLHIIKNDDFLKKTPMENLCLIYKQEISRLMQDFSNHPNVIMIKSFFNINFDKLDIHII